jgi:hypothetical protein
MRMLLTATLSTEAANAAVLNGTLESTIKKILAELKPEAAYFIASKSGERCGLIIFDMKDSSELPKIAEPWFLAFNARVSVQPAMTPQDLAAAGPGFERAIKDFGML